MASETYDGTIAYTGGNPPHLALPGQPCSSVNFSAQVTITLGSNPLGAVGCSTSIVFFDQNGHNCIKLNLDSNNIPGSAGCGTFATQITGYPVSDRAPTSGSTTGSFVIGDSNFVPGFTYVFSVEALFNIVWAESPYGAFGPISLSMTGGTTVTWDTLDSGTGFPGAIIDGAAGNTLDCLGYLTFDIDESIGATYSALVTTSQSTEELLGLNPLTPVLGETITLTGYNLGQLAESMDYLSTGTGGGEGSLASFTPSSAWSGVTGDTYAYGERAYTVHDPINNVFSNTVTYFLAPPVVPGVGTISVVFPLPVYLDCVPCVGVILVGPNGPLVAP